MVRESSAVKWELHKKWAISFVAGECTLEDAALGTNLSTRQVRRWISDLIDKHYGMVFKDLKTLSLTRRRRLADEMEKGEGIELAKRKILDEISRGEKSLKDEALERVLSRRNIDRRLNVRRKSDEKNR